MSRRQVFKSIRKQFNTLVCSDSTHLEQGHHRELVEKSLVDSFLRRNFLNWLEALSLLRLCMGSSSSEVILLGEDSSLEPGLDDAPYILVDVNLTMKEEMQ